VLDPTEANYPFLANSALWHEDDVTDNAGTTWTDRHQGIVLTTPTGNWRKDASGVYRVSGSALVASAVALPDPQGKHVVLVNQMGLTINAARQAGVYDKDAGGTVAFMQQLISSDATPNNVDFGGIDQGNYMQYDHAATQFDAAAAVGLTYVNFTAAAGTGSVAYRVGKVATVQTTKETIATLIGDMTTDIAEPGIPGNEIELGNYTSGTTQKTRVFGILIFAAAPPVTSAEAEFMYANPGYLPTTWAGLA
jgi:hypothetical protein